VAETARSIPGFMRRLRSGGLALAVALGAVIGSPQPARAQNLILDPYFTNGVPTNGFTDTAGNTYQVSGATAATFNGVTGVELTGGANSYFQIDPIGGFNPNGVNYTFSFFAAAVNPGVATSLNGSFAPVSQGACSDCSNIVISETLTSSGLTKYTVTGTSTTAFGSFDYLYVQSSGTGDVFVTGLDFQVAPAPVPGGGILSFCAVVAALAIHRMRRRRAV
jgi:hypothetical protein